MRVSQSLGPRAFLKSCGFALEKKSHQIDRLLLKALSEKDATALEMIWASRKAGFSDGLGMYNLPKSLKEAALLFSYDWPRAIATMAWFDQLVNGLEPASVVEMGCGAGFLLGYLHGKYPEVRYQGVDVASNLVTIGSKLVGVELIAGDYLIATPDDLYDLILCDFGFDIGRFKPSITPHSIEETSGVSYCPGCSDDLKSQFDVYLHAWKRWIHPGGHLAIAGRFSNFGMLRAFVLSASNVGWQPILESSSILTVTRNGAVERFPALLFTSTEASNGLELDRVARFFVD